MKLSEAIARVITLARAIRAYWEAELPKRHRDYPIVHLDEDSGPPPPEQDQLKRFLAELPPDMVYQLLLVMYLGRGDFDAIDLKRNLPKYLEQVKMNFREHAWAISQMMEKAPLADYLADGVDKLKGANVNLDRLFTSTAKSRR